VVYLRTRWATPAETEKTNDDEKHAADEDISIGNKIGEKFGKMCVDACDRGLERPYEFHLEDESANAEIIVGDTYPDFDRR